MSDEKVRTIKLKELLLELELTEGLIKSYPLSSTIVNLTRMWSLGGKIQYEEYENSIKMYIREPIETDNFDAILWHIINLLGYFPAHISTPSTNFKYSYEEAIKLMGTKFAIFFDAKYDQEISSSKFPSVLYHISPSIYEDIILKIGLVPKTKSKMSTHRDRVYLAYTEKATMGLIRNPEFKIDSRGNDIKNFTIYEVDLKKLKKDYDISLYNDPAYEKAGVYTHENIPPKYLKVIDHINTK